MPEAPYVFISYASADRERVLPVVDRLEQAGVRVWIDRDGIHGGANYALEIAEAIEGATALMLMCSPASLASRNVKQEIALAWRFERPYLPMLLDPVEIPKDIAYWLEASQWIELLDHPESEWLAALGKALDPFGIRLQATTQPQPVTATRERPLLVGREREQGILRGQLTSMLAGHGSLVLVGGEDGIGKTTLVDDLTIEAEEQGCLVLWGHAYDLSVTPPYGPWLEIFHQYRTVAGSTLPPAPSFVFDAEELSRVGSQGTLFAAVADFLRSVATHRPLMLVLDDLHWFDQASLDFVRFLARQIGSQRILLVATYRSDELHRRHPIYDLLPLLVREASAERLDVGRLAATGYHALIASRYALEDRDEERLAAYLTSHAEGNPLYAGELLRTLEHDEVVQQHGDRWQVGDLTTVRMPPLLRQVIEGRLAVLNADTRALLQVGAVIGQEVPLDLWQQASGADAAALIAALEQGRAAQLVDEGPGSDDWHFHHALIREALYTDLISLRRRGWHRTVAEALAGRPKPVPDTVAHHFQQAGDVRAVAWLLESARRARMAFAIAMAVEQLNMALALDEQHDGVSGLRGWILAALAGMGELFAHVDECMRMLDEAMDIAEQSSDAALVALVEWYRAYIEITWSAPAGEMLASARDRIQALPTEERERLFGFIYGASGAPLDPSGPEITCMVIGFLAQSGQYREALASIERVREGHPKLSAGALHGIDNALMVCFQALGRPDDALPYYGRLLAAHRRDRVSNWSAVTTWLKLRDLVLVYWPDRIALRQSVADEAVAAVRLAKDEQAFSQYMPDEVGIVWLLFLDGRWDDARRVVEEAADRWSYVMTAAPWMNLSRHQGKRDMALARLPLVFPDGPASRPGRTTFETSVYCMHPAIEIALDAGDLATARAWLECHDRWMAWSGNIPLTTIGHCLWARYYRVAEDSFTARERAEQALAHASDPRRPLALIDANRVLGQLDTEAAQLNAAEEHLRASLRLADACAAPFERALTLLEIARLRIAEERSDEARALLAEVGAICEPLGAKPTLELVSELERTLLPDS